MYVQITTKCNMACEHCGMNCNKQDGENMSFETFKEALKHDDHITIGGGEPTIHPQFEKFLLYALGKCENIFIITNGKKTDTALGLASLNDMSEYQFGAELSQDPYHDPIDEKVVKAFEGHIRDTSQKPINAGRCDWGNNECICEDMFVKPNGDVYQCGCDDSPKVGNVFDDTVKPMNSTEDDWGEWICHKQVQQIEEAA